MEIKKQIKLVALDLDGTTLTSDKKVSERTKKALGKAAEKGVHVVIATGRGFSSLPDEVKNIKGVKYAVCANGADIRMVSDGTSVYRSFICERQASHVLEYLKDKEYMLEIFVDGKAYIGQKYYDDVIEGRIGYRMKDYIANTRKPVNDIIEFAKEHLSEIENISIFFEDLSEKNRLWQNMKQFDSVTVTSSFPHNIEIGGSNTSKASALLHLADKLEVNSEEMMCCGDSLNDMAMLQTAGIAVAMANSEESVKEAADFVTDTNDDDGVAKAVEKFILKG